MNILKEAIETTRADMKMSDAADSAKVRSTKAFLRTAMNFRALP